MPRPRAQRAAASLPLVPRVRVWLECDGRYAFGPGMSQILQAVERTGSIKQAAHELGISYRHVWGRVKEAEAALGQTLVETHVGGAGTQRSFLTDLARRLIADFLQLRSRVFEIVDAEFTRGCSPGSARRP